MNDFLLKMHGESPATATSTSKISGTSARGGGNIGAQRGRNDDKASAAQLKSGKDSANTQNQRVNVPGGKGQKNWKNQEH